MRSFWKKLPILFVTGAVSASLLLVCAHYSVQMEESWQKANADVLVRRTEDCLEALELLALHDSSIYRSVFGLPSGVDSLQPMGKVSASLSRETVSAVVGACEDEAAGRSRSLDEITTVLESAGNMATCIPAICPLDISSPKCYISSPFGYRHHPILKYTRMHKGIDFRLDRGTPIYAAGDARVDKIKIERRGYGRQVILDHGFGYKTRYAHLGTILVTEGMLVHRGDQIATGGNSGLSTAPHLHYEVIYKGRNVNPYHFFDKDIPSQQYQAMVHPDPVFASVK